MLGLVNEAELVNIPISPQHLSLVEMEEALCRKQVTNLFWHCTYGMPVAQ